MSHDEFTKLVAEKKNAQGRTQPNDSVTLAGDQYMFAKRVTATRQLSDGVVRRRLDASVWYTAVTESSPMGKNMVYAFRKGPVDVAYPGSVERIAWNDAVFVQTVPLNKNSRSVRRQIRAQRRADEDRGKLEKASIRATMDPEIHRSDPKAFQDAAEAWDIEMVEKRKRAMAVKRERERARAEDVAWGIPPKTSKPVRRSGMKSNTALRGARKARKQTEKGQPDQDT